ncbi:hypothetical protein WCLP8_2970001 [uncultured Gammaproteobacteria bacterium]
MRQPKQQRVDSIESIKATTAIKDQAEQAYLSLINSPELNSRDAPLMRFDGYYLLSDGLDLANLQERSFAFGVCCFGCLINCLALFQDCLILTSVA